MDGRVDDQLFNPIQWYPGPDIVDVVILELNRASEARHRRSDSAVLPGHGSDDQEDISLAPSSGLSQLSSGVFEEEGASRNLT